MKARRNKRGPVVAFVSKTRVRRFIEEEKLPPRRVMPDGFWAALDEAVKARTREELSRGQIPLPL